ncbi:hypothetical protein C8R43DRAFT_1153727 [Mycena crocata]|nr:hypothetical protein C8R43DRAFT_1153727 [Mycena crocata]
MPNPSIQTLPDVKLKRFERDNFERRIKDLLRKADREPNQKLRDETSQFLQRDDRALEHILVQLELEKTTSKDIIRKLFRTVHGPMKKILDDAWHNYEANSKALRKGITPASSVGIDPPKIFYSLPLSSVQRVPSFLGYQYFPRSDTVRVGKASRERYNFLRYLTQFTQGPISIIGHQKMHPMLQAQVFPGLYVPAHKRQPVGGPAPTSPITKDSLGNLISVDSEGNNIMRMPCYGDSSFDRRIETRQSIIIANIVARAKEKCAQQPQGEGVLNAARSECLGSYKSCPGDDWNDNKVEIVTHI